MENKQKTRQSNFELLRIVGMILIILHHYAWHGGIVESNAIGINKYIGQMLALCGKIGVNIFVLISGYFLINSKVKIKNLLKLIFQIFCYTIFCIILKKVLFDNVKQEEIIGSIFPFFKNIYWFFDVYIGIYLLSPFLNKIIYYFKKEKLQILIILLGFILCVLPSIGIDTFAGNLQWFVFMYLIGAYIKIHDIHFLKTEDIKYWIFINIDIIIVLLVTINAFFERPLNGVIFIKEMDFIIIFAISILIFLYFKNLNLKTNKVINFFGKTSFAVYLLHDNQYIKSFMWKEIFKTPSFYLATPINLIVHVLVCIFVIYIVSSLIEYIRQKFLQTPIFNSRKIQEITNAVDKYFEIE